MLQYLVGARQGGSRRQLHIAQHVALVLIRQKGKPDELYDLAADPSQKNDLAGQRPEVVRELGEHLKRSRRLTNANCRKKDLSANGWCALA